MRIVTLKELIELPNGTVFQQLEDEYAEINGFYRTDKHSEVFVKTAAYADTEIVYGFSLFAQDGYDANQNGIISLDTIECRAVDVGCTKPENRWLVYEKSDIQHMVNVLSAMLKCFDLSKEEADAELKEITAVDAGDISASI